MRIKLSDYILEQSISISSAIDIELEQLVAEMDVCCKLAMAYNKQLLMEDYFQEEVQGGNQQANSSTPTAQPVQQTQPVQPAQAAPPTNNQQQTNQQTNQQNTQQANANQGFFASVWGYIKRFFEWIGNKLAGTPKEIKESGQYVNKVIQDKPPEAIQQFITENNINVEQFNPNKVSEMTTKLNELITRVSDNLNKTVNTSMDVKKDRSDDTATNKTEKLVESFKSIIDDLTVNLQPIQELINQKPQEGQDQVALFKQYVAGYVDLFKSEEDAEFKNVMNISSRLKNMGEWIGYMISSGSTRQIGIKDTRITSGNSAKASTAQTRYNNLIGEKNSDIDKKLRPILVDMMKKLQASSDVLSTVANDWKQLKRLAGVGQPQQIPNK